MKNIAKTIVLLALLQPVVSRAQQPETYFDTSYVPYMMFDWNAWIAEGSGNRRRTYGEILLPGGGYLTGDIVEYYNAASPAGIEIWGLGVMHRGGNNPVPLNPPEYLLLYDARPDTFELMAKVSWSYADPDTIIGYNTYDAINQNDTSECPPTSVVYYNVPFGFKKYIFDQPIHLYDSFYVGITQRHPMILFMQMGERLPPPWDGELGYTPGEDPNRGISFSFTARDTGTACTPPPFHCKVRNWNLSSPYPRFEWADADSKQSLMVYPLVRKITEVQLPACTDVEEFRISGRLGAVTEFQWVSDGLHNEWELSYGIEGTPPDSGTVLSLTEPRYWLNDNAYPDTPMVAYIRTVCREQGILRHGRWSAGIHWDGHLIHQGIPAEGIGAYVELLPNPAKGMTVVSSSYRLTRIRAYNMQGQLVLDQRPSLSQSATLDLTAWPKGTYLLRITTLAGIVSKKLLVE